MEQAQARDRSAPVLPAPDESRAKDDGDQSKRHCHIG